MDIFSWAFEWLFSTKQFPPRWECGTWDNFTGWVYIFASLGIFAAYYSIPVALIVILRKAKFLYSIPRIRQLLAMFSLFIFACGTGHLLDTAMFYWPGYRVLALVNTFTAIVSWITIFILVPHIGRFISMQDPRKVFELNEQLIESNKELERYQLFFDMTLDMCCIAKGDKFIRVNKSWEKTLGFPKDNLENNKWIDFVHPDDKKATQVVGDRLAMGDFQIENFENRYRTKNNEYRWLSWMAMNNPSDNSEYFCVARDITDYKTSQEKLKTSEERLRLMIESCKAYAIFALDPNGNIVSWNVGAETLNGYKANEIIGKHFSIFYPKDKLDSRWPEKELEIAERNGMSVDEGWRVKKDKSLIWCSVTINAIRNSKNELVGFMKVTRDITEMKKKQDALEKANSELEQFSYVASHDLKAPLRAISNLATWLQEDCGDQLSDKGKDYLRLMVGRIARMNMLIEGLLQVSRVGRKHIELEDVDLATLVAEIIDGLDKNDFTINVAPLPKVRANKVSIGQVFSNLIVNAIKHHPRTDGVVNLTYQELPEFHQFAVCDDGEGIPKEFQSKLFVMFQTLKPKDDTNSTGIGLALCKKIVEHFGGTIKLESDRGKGAKFIFTIPK